MKQPVNLPATWFDLWDLGTAHARLGQREQNREEMEHGHNLIKQAGEIHRVAEPDDNILLAKILDSQMQCSMVLGDWCEDRREAVVWYEKAERAGREAYHLFLDTGGPQKPLLGYMAGTLAFCLEMLSKWEDQREVLTVALRVEATKDIITVPGMAELVERVLDCHRHLEDWTGLCNYDEILNSSIRNLQSRNLHRTDAMAYSNLLVLIVRMLVASDDGTAASMPGALALLQEGEEALRHGVAEAEKERAEQIAAAGKCPAVTGKLFRPQLSKARESVVRIQAIVDQGQTQEAKTAAAAVTRSARALHRAWCLAWL